MDTIKNLELLIDIVYELYGRELANNLNDFQNVGYLDLCDQAIKLLEEIKK